MCVEGGGGLRRGGGSLRQGAHEIRRGWGTLHAKTGAPGPPCPKGGGAAAPSAAPSTCTTTCFFLPDDSFAAPLAKSAGRRASVKSVMGAAAGGCGRGCTPLPYSVNVEGGTRWLGAWVSGGGRLDPGFSSDLVPNPGPNMPTNPHPPFQQKWRVQTPRLFHSHCYQHSMRRSVPPPPWASLRRAPPPSMRRRASDFVFVKPQST